MSDKKRFSAGVKLVIENLPNFDIPNKVQVFESNIRILGGLLSAHLFASSEEHGMKIDGYKGELLTLAHDLGSRLLVAFDTDTGIPYARVNLRSGVPLYETQSTCVAGAGTLILEFGTLSRLTGDPRFEVIPR